MSDNVYVNADRSAVVDEFDPGKKWQMRRKDAQRLGLLPDGDATPQARRANKDISAREDTAHATTEPREDTVREFGTVPKKPAAKK